MNDMRHLIDRDANPVPNIVAFDAQLLHREDIRPATPEAEVA